LINAERECKNVPWTLNAEVQYYGLELEMAAKDFVKRSSTERISYYASDDSMAPLFVRGMDMLSIAPRRI
jgi:hypothetical protein